jgi:8-oxo-dGTP pyrophosphatase MutT (NUDIX family)
MLAGSTSISEWDLFGRIITNEDDEPQFSYGGIVNRAKISLELKNTQGFSEFCFPVVLIMLYTERFGDFKSVIQERTPYNATSDIGTFSNISGRISTDDVHEPGGKGNYFTLSFDSSALVATNKFNAFCGWSAGKILPDSIWKQAAIRELEEELGLDVSPERLKLRGSHYLQRDDGNLYFQIYSLLLLSDVSLNKHELDIIGQRRPYVSLKEFTFPELEGLWRQKKLNRLLQNKFLDVFVPNFSELQIRDSPADAAAYIRAMKR